MERGRFVELPILGALAESLSIVFQGNDASDRAGAALTLLGDHLNVRDLKIVSQTLAVRGEGEVYFDGPINFRVNAGGVEKIQESLGPLGELFGALTDKLGKYHVTGTFEDPDVSVKPLGIGADPEIR